jgi:transposase
MSNQKTTKRRVFSAEFKRDAVNLIVNQGYSFHAAAAAVGVGERSLRLWHRQLAPKPAPLDENATVAEVFASSNEVYGSRKVAKTLAMNPKMEKACRNRVPNAQHAASSQ